MSSQAKSKTVLRTGKRQLVHKAQDQRFITQRSSASGNVSLKSSHRNTASVTKQDKHALTRALNRGRLVPVIPAPAPAPAPHVAHEEHEDHEEHEPTKEPLPLTKDEGERLAAGIVETEPPPHKE
jgi:hypothetical protein